MDGLLKDKKWVVQPFAVIHTMQVEKFKNSASDSKMCKNSKKLSKRIFIKQKVSKKNNLKRI